MFRGSVREKPANSFTVSVVAAAVAAAVDKSLSESDVEFDLQASGTAWCLAVILAFVP